jgi:hypothetical protein
MAIEYVFSAQTPAALSVEVWRCYVEVSESNQDSAGLFSDAALTRRIFDALNLRARDVIALEVGKGIRTRMLRPTPSA